MAPRLPSPTVLTLLLFNVVLTLLLVHVRYGSDREPKRMLNEEPEPGASVCAASNSVLHTWPEELHVTVKTTVSHHASRLPHLARTWMQSLHPHQVHVVTDTADDVIHNIFKTLNVRVVGASEAEGAHCSASHHRADLCCKSGLQYELYYKEIDMGIKRSWFCHFDDDIYVNVPTLMKKLSQYDGNTDKIYIGHYPKWYPYVFTKKVLQQKGLVNRKTLYYALGASYCISASVMEELRTFLRGSENFVKWCNVFEVPDDTTVGALIVAHLGHKFQNLPNMITHIEKAGYWAGKPVDDLLTFGYDIVNKTFFAPLRDNFTPEQDPTRFLSYHCQRFPEIGWCSNSYLL